MGQPWVATGYVVLMIGAAWTQLHAMSERAPVVREAHGGLEKIRPDFLDGGTKIQSPQFGRGKYLSSARH
jgi:hypothetical protein